MGPAPLGVLPFGAAALLAGCHALSCRLFAPPRPAYDRACATAVLAPAAAIGLVHLLGAFGLLRGVVVLAATMAAAGLMLLVAGPAGRARAAEDGRAAGSLLVRVTRSGPLAAAAAVGLCAVAAATAAAWLLAPWAWDALGYHLPIVHDALQTGAVREVPTSVPYVNTYPRAVDMFFVWWRVLLADDTLVELAQLPFGLAAVTAVAALAARAGAAPHRAAALAALFVAVPVTALQLATNYVDVAYAALLLLAGYFVTGPLERADAACAAVALGLFLASKPSSPPAFALLGLVLLVRGHRRGALSRALAAIAAALALGAGRYVATLLAHGNPLWPVAVHLGPITLPGPWPAGYFFNLGVPEPYVHYGWLRRLLASWFAWPARYIYDMRIGGLGPLFALGLLPVATATLWRPRQRAIAGPVALIALCALATPAAFWTRYTLALPGALLALGIVASERWPRRARSAAEVAAVVLAAAGLFAALPGFTDGGPSLWTLLRATPAERAAAVSIDGHEPDWAAARALLRDGEAFGFDPSFGLPGQLWRPDGRGRVAYLDEASPTAPRLLDWVARERVAVAALGDGPTQAGALARAMPARFAPLFRCPLDPCTVYRVRAAETVARP